VDEAEFRAHVLEPAARRNVVQLYFGPAGDLAGYCALHRFSRVLKGRECFVIRGEAGLRRDYRGRGTTYWFGMLFALRQKLRHPLTPVYYLGTLVHASSYHLFCKYFRRVYPAHDCPMPADLRELALELADSFDAPAVDPADPLVRDVGWITIETPQEARLSARTDLADVPFYRARNPGYVSGHGLVVLVPLDLRNLGGALVTYLGEALRNLIRRRRPRL